MKKMLMVAFIALSVYGGDVQELQELKVKVNDLSNALKDWKSKNEENSMYSSKKFNIIDEYKPHLILARDEGDSFLFDALISERNVKLIPVEKEIERTARESKVLWKKYEKIQKELGEMAIEFSKTHTDGVINRFAKAAQDKKNIDKDFEDKKCDKMYIPKLESNKCSPRQAQKSQICKKLENEFKKCWGELAEKQNNANAEYFKAEDNIVKELVSN